MLNVVVVDKVATSRQGDCSTVILLEMSMKLAMHDLIGEPVQYIKQCTTSLTNSDDCGVKVRRACMLTRSDSSGNDVGIDNLATTSSGTFKCSFCMDENCDWSKHGETLINQVTKEFVGRMVDECGIVVDGCNSGTVIGNKQLRFVAYSLYTNLKYGYLGKRNRVPIPSCVEQGIRENFPDSNKCYIGFKVAKYN
jgi:hypothetical protein